MNGEYISLHKDKEQMRGGAVLGDWDQSDKIKSLCYIIHCQRDRFISFDLSSSVDAMRVLLLSVLILSTHGRANCITEYLVLIALMARLT